jgi:predicted transcriptional regulator
MTLLSLLGNEDDDRENRTITFTMDSQLVDRVDYIADLTGRSRSSLIANAVGDWLGDAEHSGIIEQLEGAQKKKGGKRK